VTSSSSSSSSFTQARPPSGGRTVCGRMFILCPPVCLAMVVCTRVHLTRPVSSLACLCLSFAWAPYLAPWHAQIEGGGRRNMPEREGGSMRWSGRLTCREVSQYGGTYRVNSHHHSHQIAGYSIISSRLKDHKSLMPGQPRENAEKIPRTNKTAKQQNIKVLPRSTVVNLAQFTT